MRQALYSELWRVFQVCKQLRGSSLVELPGADGSSCCPCVCWTLIPLLAGGELTALPPPSVFLYRLPGPKLLPHSNRSHLGSPLGGCWWQLKILDVWYRMCQDKILATQDAVFLCVDLWDRLLCLVVSRRLFSLVVSRRLEVGYIFSFTSQTCETSKQIMKHMISH